MTKKLRINIVIAFLMGLGFAMNCEADERPNIVLVMVDDLGFSDLGCYGGEIETPNLDRLAERGIRFTQFYNCAKCETTRATLLSGRYYPEVNNRKLENCVTIAEVLKLAGYSTLMTGKWHLESDPINRGFDKYFGHLSGATNFFVGDNTFRLGTEPFTVPKQGFYTTDANTDYAIKFLNEVDREKPFFLYIAHNAPHYPLHAKKEDFEKYGGKYHLGWDQLRKARFQKQKELQLFDGDFELPSRPENVPAWDSLSEEEKEVQEITMAAYAAMIDCVDQNMGRLVEHLKKLDEYENTIILFLSDNGACPFQRTKPPTLQQKLMPYNPESYWTYDRGWAHACNTPFREYKQNQHEGGICTPMIVHWPATISSQNKISRQTGHLVDIMATCLDVAQFEYPTEFKGKPVGPKRGLSLRPIFEGRKRESHEYLFFSFYGKNNALRVGDWKLVNKNREKFELYNLSEDRNELNNRIDTDVDKFRSLKEKFENITQEFGVSLEPKRTKRRR